jgi:hypothetical protein
MAFPLLEKASTSLRSEMRCIRQGEGIIPVFLRLQFMDGSFD